MMAILAVHAVGLSIAKVHRGLEPALLGGMAVSGVLTGWVLGVLPLGGWLAGLLSVLLGLASVLYRVGGLGPQFATLFVRAVELRRASWLWAKGGPLPNPEPLLASWQNLSLSIMVVLSRVGNWFQTLFGAEATFDPVAMAFLWSLIVWGVAAWSGWALCRRRPFWAIAPAGTLLVATLGYYGSGTGAILWVFALTLALMAVVVQDLRERRWVQEGVVFSKKLWRASFGWAVLVTMALVLFAALTQSITVRQIIRVAEQLTGRDEGEAGESAGQEKVIAVGFTYSEVRFPGLPRRHLIGSGPELSEKVVMFIRTNDPPPAREDVSIDEFLPQYYWRSNSYDRYTGHGWVTGFTEEKTYEADEQVRLPELPGHRLVTQQVRTVASLGPMIYSAGALVTADQPFNVEWRNPDDVFGATFQSEVSSSRIVSLVPELTEEDLRSAGVDYPQWILDRYLDLPSSVPERVLALARDLTATGPTPYDRALAIERYLRGFPYTLDLPAPPERRDVVDYFLFDLEKGYCDYYATSMVVLARAAGIPARLVIGYLGGMYDLDARGYVVTEAEAHSWVEVYFPGIGWVDFEPTAGRPAIDRSEEGSGLDRSDLRDLKEGSNIEPSDLDLEARTPAKRWASAVLIAVVSLVSAAWGMSALNRLRLRRMSPQVLANLIYRRVRHHAKQMQAGVHDGDTPYEAAQALGRYVDELAKVVKWASALTSTSREVKRLMELYVQTVYAPHGPDVNAKPEMLRLWKRTTTRLWLARLISWWRRRRQMRTASGLERARSS